MRLPRHRDLSFAVEQEAREDRGYERRSGTRWSASSAAASTAAEAWSDALPASGLHELTESGTMRDVLRCSRRLKPGGGSVWRTGESFPRVS